MDTFKTDLELNGYCIIENILSKEEIDKSKLLFHNWKNGIPNLDKLHNTIDPHGIYKFHEIGHQEHSWFIRTRPKVIEVFKKLWDSEELIVSFDGTCYIEKESKKKDNIWTHTDQASNNSEITCYQGFVSLTDNKERTLVVYNGSHKLHSEYFKNKDKSSKNWNLIEHDYLENIKESKKILNIPAGSLVLWDSRTFHQNRYSNPNCEERLVQYVCYLPKSHPKNTKSQREKRLKYFNARRTTTHWPCPIKVNGLQPQTYGDTSKLIDYSNLLKPNLEDYLEEIYKLI